MSADLLTVIYCGLFLTHSLENYYVVYHRNTFVCDCKIKFLSHYGDLLVSSVKPDQKTLGISAPKNIFVLFPIAS